MAQLAARGHTARQIAEALFVGERTVEGHLASVYAKYGLTYDDFLSSRFVRLRRIRELLSEGLLDDMLHRQTDAHFSEVAFGARQTSR